MRMKEVKKGNKNRKNKKRKKKENVQNKSVSASAKPRRADGTPARAQQAPRDKLHQRAKKNIAKSFRDTQNRFRTKWPFRHQAPTQSSTKGRNFIKYNRRRIAPGSTKSSIEGRRTTLGPVTPIGGFRRQRVNARQCFFTPFHGALCWSLMRLRRRCIVVGRGSVKRKCQNVVAQHTGINQGFGQVCGLVQQRLDDHLGIRMHSLGVLVHRLIRSFEGQCRRTALER